MRRRRSCLCLGTLGCDAFLCLSFLYAARGMGFYRSGVRWRRCNAFTFLVFLKERGRLKSVATPKHSFFSIIL